MSYIKVYYLKFLFAIANASHFIAQNLYHYCLVESERLLNELKEDSE